LDNNSKSEILLSDIKDYAIIPLGSLDYRRNAFINITNLISFWILYFYFFHFLEDIIFILCLSGKVWTIRSLHYWRSPSLHSGSSREFQWWVTKDQMSSISYLLWSLSNSSLVIIVWVLTACSRRLWILLFYYYRSLWITYSFTYSTWMVFPMPICYVKSCAKQKCRIHNLINFYLHFLILWILWELSCKPRIITSWSPSLLESITGLVFPFVSLAISFSLSFQAIPWQFLALQKLMNPISCLSTKNSATNIMALTFWTCKKRLMISGNDQRSER